jgi:hypothetical protein
MISDHIRTHVEPSAWNHLIKIEVFYFLDKAASRRGPLKDPLLGYELVERILQLDHVHLICMCLPRFPSRLSRIARRFQFPIRVRWKVSVQRRPYISESHDRESLCASSTMGGEGRPIEQRHHLLCSQGERHPIGFE